MNNGERQLLRHEVILSIFEEYGPVLPVEKFEKELYKRFMKIKQQEGISLWNLGEQEHMERRFAKEE